MQKISIKSILIHECQHKSTSINTNQHESNTSHPKLTRAWHESTRAQLKSTRINTSIKHILITKSRINMAKQNPNVTYQWCFLEEYVECCICQWFKFFSPIYFQLYHKVLLFYKGIYMIKRHVIVTCNNYYQTDNHFIKTLRVKKEKTILE